MDFVRELRLRQWARQHFVVAELRKNTWHPVVLDEMQRRDEELLSAAQLDSDLSQIPVSVELPQQSFVRDPEAAGQFIQQTSSVFAAAVTDLSSNLDRQASIASDLDRLIESIMPDAAAESSGASIESSYLAEIL